MDVKNKTLFELPKLFALDGKEVTGDQMLTEALLPLNCLFGGTANDCLQGSTNDCNGGSSPVLE